MSRIIVIFISLVFHVYWGAVNASTSSNKSDIANLEELVGNQAIFEMYYRTSFLHHPAPRELKQAISDADLTNALSNQSPGGEIFIDACRRMNNHTEFLGMVTRKAWVHSNAEDYKERLKFIPYLLMRFTHLDQLVLAHNAFVTVPLFMGDFKLLKHLDLSYNLLTAVPDILESLPELRELRLAGNRLKTLDPVIGTLKELRRLDLSHNKLEALSSELCDLTKLVELDLSHNQLSGLPERIVNFKNLRALSLSHNLFRCFPIFLADLVTLEMLILSFNVAQSLPPSFFKLKKLKQLHLSANHMGNQTKELVDKMNSARVQDRHVKVLLDDKKLSEKNSN